METVLPILKFESGVHRVQRVPATESQGRIHTSTVTVAVLPEAEEADIEINMNDLKVVTYIVVVDMVDRVSIRQTAQFLNHPLTYRYGCYQPGREISD